VAPNSSGERRRRRIRGTGLVTIEHLKETQDAIQVEERQRPREVEEWKKNGDHSIAHHHQLGCTLIGATRRSSMTNSQLVLLSLS
jgi:hypothetical protein